VHTDSTSLTGQFTFEPGMNAGQLAVPVTGRQLASSAECQCGGNP
jgi:hypothetical protein